jgi:ubiquinone/menaquinone biosynthesis C-methylase UbiE
VTHVFDPANALRLERDERRELLQPLRTLARFGLARAMTVVDVGAGTGFFTRAASELVGPEGHVHAVDVSAAMLDHLRDLGVPPNVSVSSCEPLRVPLPAGTADIVLAAFVVHEAPDRRVFLEELVRLLKPGGRVLLFDWKRQEEEHGPPMAERLDEADLDRMLDGRWILDSGDLNSSHYYRIFQPRS